MNLNVAKRDTMLTAKKRAETSTVVTFLGYVTDNSGNVFRDNSGQGIMSIGNAESPTYTVVERDTLFSRKEREE